MTLFLSTRVSCGVQWWNIHVQNKNKIKNRSDHINH